MVLWTDPGPRSGYPRTLVPAPGTCANSMVLWTKSCPGYLCKFDGTLDPGPHPGNLYRLDGTTDPGPGPWSLSRIPVDPGSLIPNRSTSGPWSSLVPVDLAPRTGFLWTLVPNLSTYGPWSLTWLPVQTRWCCGPGPWLRSRRPGS